MTFEKVIEKIKDNDWAIGERCWSYQLKKELGENQTGTFFASENVKENIQKMMDVYIIVFFNDKEQRTYHLVEGDLYAEFVNTLAISDNVKKVSVRSIKNNKKRYAYADELGILKSIPNDSFDILVDAQNNWRLYHDTI